MSHGIKISVTVGDDKGYRWINLAYAVEVASVSCCAGSSSDSGDSCVVFGELAGKQAIL